jgi:spore maturation protein CgeB
MNIVIFGSSLVSSYWNGAATYYRGMCKALHAAGRRIIFVEPDLYGRQQRRDIADPPYAEVRVCRSWDDLARQVAAAATADVVAKCSGVGGWDDDLARGVAELRSRRTLTAFWDVDAPATLSDTFEQEDDGRSFRSLIRRFDSILLYGGGQLVVDTYTRLGVRHPVLVYNAVDADEYYPAEPDPAKSCDLLFMGNRMPDREERVRRLFFAAAEVAPDLSFVLGGEGWGDYPLPANVRWISHVPTADHRVWNSSARMVLNINRNAMAAYGFSPPTRVCIRSGRLRRLPDY